VSGAGVTGTSPPRWTPDGRIVFEQELTGYANIWIADPDGTHQKQLTTAGNDDQSFICSSGRKIVYISDRSGSPAIWTDIDGRRQTW